jgi:hypothetical protein
MTLKRQWLKNLLSIHELPERIRNADRYKDKDYWIDRARQTDDLQYIGIWFDDGESHLWRKIGQFWELVRVCPAVPEEQTLEQRKETAIQDLAQCLYEEYVETAENMNKENTEQYTAEGLFESDNDDGSQFDEWVDQIIAQIRRRIELEKAKGGEG